MSLNKRDLLTVLLVTIAVSSVVIGGASTANYFQFYSSLQQLQLNLVSLQWETNGTAIDALANFTIVNPTGYVGLNLKLFQGIFDIRGINSNVSVPFGALPLAEAQGPLGPGFARIVTIPIDAGGRQGLQANELLQNGDQIEFVFSIDLVLSTFLDKASGVSAAYECTGTSGPGTCEQLSVAVLTSSEGGGGGGGV